MSTSPIAAPATEFTEMSLSLLLVKTETSTVESDTAPSVPYKIDLHPKRIIDLTKSHPCLIVCIPLNTSATLSRLDFCKFKISHFFPKINRFFSIINKLS